MRARIVTRARAFEQLRPCVKCVLSKMKRRAALRVFTFLARVRMGIACFSAFLRISRRAARCV